MSADKHSPSRVSKNLDEESPEASSKTASSQDEEKQVDKNSQASASSPAKTKSDDQAGEDFAPSSSFEHKCVRCEAPYSTPELKRSLNLCPSCQVLLSSPAIPPRRPLSPEVIIDDSSRFQIFEPLVYSSSDDVSVKSFEYISISGSQKKLYKKRKREHEEREEKERLEKEEKERLEKERLEREEKERLEKERLEREEKERLEKERLEREEKERLEKERLESEERERREQEGVDQEEEGERIPARENRNAFGLLAFESFFIIISTTILGAWVLNKLIGG